MEGLYQTLPYPYLSQSSTSEYPSASNNNSGSPSTTPLVMYRPTLERPFQSLDDHPSSPSTLNWSNNAYHHRHHYHHHHQQQAPINPTNYGCYGNTGSVVMASASPTRPKVSTNIWEDEGTLCFQVDAKGICVARRQDNDMINGTKLLNVVGMSRGKRDGILKNEKGRVVVKVGAMHLKGVWIPFQRARELATKFKIVELLYPLFADDPSAFLCNNNSMASNEVNTEKTKMMSTAFQQHRHSMDYNWNKGTNYLQHYPQVIHRNSIHGDLSTNNSPIPKLMTQTSEDNAHDVYEPQYDYRPFQSRNSISSLSSHHSVYLYPSHHSPEEKLAMEPFYSLNEKEKEPSTPSSWYSPETPTAVLYQQQKKRKSSLSSDGSSQKMHPYARTTKKVKVLQVE